MIELTAISKTYDLGHLQIDALRDVTLTINRGDFLTVMGPSGSGKSTLLHLLGLLDIPSAGTYKLEGHEISRLPDFELSRIRNRHFGFIFQSFNLFPEFNALENVMMPLVYARVPLPKRKRRAMELLERVGLAERIHHYPSMLSGGEQQRVAIARALANEPSLILADEPTGNLPTAMGLDILKIIYELNEQGVTVVMVTHDQTLGACGRKTIRLQDGQIMATETVANRFDPRYTERNSA